MQKIVVDTNVLVSALIQRNYPFYILTELFSNDELELCISDELFAEYFDVLNRKKFTRYIDFVSKAQILLADIESRAKKYIPKVKLDIIGDKDDNKLLELAETCKADFLITGNTNDFTMSEYKHTKILTPKDYWIDHIMK